MAQFMPKLETAITSFHIAYSIYFRSISNVLAFILEDVKEISKFFLKIEISECSIFKLFSSKGLKKIIMPLFHYVFRVTFRNYCL